MRLAVAPHGLLRQSHTPGEGRAQRRWTTAISAALVLHAGALIVAGHLPEASPPPPLDPPAFKVELVRLPPARPQPARITHAAVRPQPKHVVLRPPRPPAPHAEPPRRLRLTIPKTQFHRALVAAPLLTRASVADAPHAAAAQPLTAAPAAPQTAASPAAAVPVQPAPAATAAPPVPEHPSAVPNWQGLLLARLAKFKQYPPAARARNQQGMAYVRFSVDRHGNVLAATLERTSGYDLLDAEAVALLHRAAPLPPTPPEMPDPAELVVPIQFSLTPGAF